MKKGNGGKSTVNLVTELVKPITDGLGLILWDVLFEKEGSTWTVKIIIDKEDGVSLEDCEAVSRPLDAILDEKDPIEQSYCLEVSSAGIEREITKEWHFEKYIGQKVTVLLIRPFEETGERSFVGELLAFDGSFVMICSNENEYKFNMPDVAHIRLYAEF